MMRMSVGMIDVASGLMYDVANHLMYGVAYRLMCAGVNGRTRVVTEIVATAQPLRPVWRQLHDGECRPYVRR